MSKRPFLIVLVGATSSVLLAQSLANSEAKNARDTFRFASDEIASSLKLSISHEEDLVVSTSAYMATSPAARTPVAFDRWIESVAAWRRFPELEDIGFTVLVATSRLAAFKAHEAKDPVRPFGARGPGAWEAGVLPTKVDRSTAWQPRESPAAPKRTCRWASTTARWRRR